ncbi:MFS transporter [Flavobacterium rakeshii]|uniref:Major facilitator transporter n=1 Tax=Flavobacterium beibuense F44-8 TaxID=1406840 RepID=A0A0A2LSA1_9FLAO|nr:MULTISPECIES: MFS transporter [Flavobacterium]KGO83172.1 major facilitator transporter [Flavobacterium beibuense F44-8]MEE1897436.1 MFS transporter [Flavobacterium rakeshii]
MATGVLQYKKHYSDVKSYYLNRVRWAVSLYYFAMGLCFATWASRIPDIKSMLNLSEGDLGTVLFAIPFGQLFIMPFSGTLATKYGSHKTAVAGLSLYVISLVTLGLATQRDHLLLALFFFGVFSNLTNISINTQGIYAESLYKRAIMSSFHGAWSIAGFTGAVISLGMTALNLSPLLHFAIVSAILLVVIATNYKYLVRVKNKPTEEKKKKGLPKLNPALLWLGIIGFCCMLSEGIMFDWSGVYFKDVVKAPEKLVVLGYTSFMLMMASGRFLGDWVVQKFGRKKVLQVSGCLISLGLFSAVLLPYVVTAALAFMLVGIGVSTVVPSVYSLAGRTEGIAPSIALTMVSSISFLGFMLGPPVIGYIAEAWGLKLSFAIIGIFGFIITIMVSRIKSVSDLFIR